MSPSRCNSEAPSTNFRPIAINSTLRKRARAHGGRHDRQAKVMDNLIREHDAAVYGDKGYRSGA